MPVRVPGVFLSFEFQKDWVEMWEPWNLEISPLPLKRHIAYTTIVATAQAVIAIRLRHDYDEKLTCSFFARVESCRMEAGERDTP